MRDTFLESGGLFCFSRICKFGNFKNSFATVASLSELSFRFRKFIAVSNEKSDFYELGQQHKQLKTMKMSEA